MCFTSTRVYRIQNLPRRLDSTPITQTLKSTGRDMNWTGDQLHADAATLRTPHDPRTLPTTPKSWQRHPARTSPAIPPHTGAASRHARSTLNRNITSKNYNFTKHLNYASWHDILVIITSCIFSWGIWITIITLRAFYCISISFRVFIFSYSSNRIYINSKFWFSAYMS